MAHTDVKYCREYRQKLGFNNQQLVKVFFAAKDIHPDVDYNYVVLLNQRLFEIIEKIDSLVDRSIKLKDLTQFTVSLI